MAFFTAGHAASVIRDKFLVMSTELEDSKSPSELAALWKTLPKTNIVEHRYKLRVGGISLVLLVVKDYA